MAPSERLYLSFASQPEHAQPMLPRHTPSHLRRVDEAKLQILYIPTIQLWVSLARLNPLLYY